MPHANCEKETDYQTSKVYTIHALTGLSSSEVYGTYTKVPSGITSPTFILTSDMVERRKKISGPCSSWNLAYMRRYDARERSTARNSVAINHHRLQANSAKPKIESHYTSNLYTNTVSSRNTSPCTLKLRKVKKTESCRKPAVRVEITPCRKAISVYIQI